jgi:hypothetical protein
MLKALLIIAYILPNGDLGLEQTALKECPPQASFKAFMDKQVADGVIKTYNAICRPLGVEQET